MLAAHLFQPQNIDAHRGCNGRRRKNIRQELFLPVNLSDYVPPTASELLLELELLLPPLPALPPPLLPLEGLTPSPAAPPEPLVPLKPGVPLFAAL